MVQAFRRDKNDAAVKVYRLQGLLPAATYELTDLEATTTRKVSGRQLMEEGPSVEIKRNQGRR